LSFGSEHIFRLETAEAGIFWLDLRTHGDNRAMRIEGDRRLFQYAQPARVTDLDVRRLGDRIVSTINTVTGELDIMSTGPASVNPSTVAPYMFSLMLRNIATYGFQIADHNKPGNPGGYTVPGCVLASPSWPSYPGNVAPIIEDYVFNWTRDAAITMSAVLNQAPAGIPATGASDLLASYVNFASTCQASGGGIGQAHYTPEGASTGSADESDGPALRPDSANSAVSSPCLGK
jgi:hypothetical protein